eukprot:scaffold2.g7485.t1
MELEEEESYAVAALFTLALHATQHERGNDTDQAWGEPPDLEADPAVLQRLDAAGLEAFWGYDCVAHPGASAGGMAAACGLPAAGPALSCRLARARGLLERVYRTLRLPRTKWRGLQALPTVAPSSADDTFRSMVRSLIGVLDPELAASLPPLRSAASLRRRHGAVGGAGAGDEGAAPGAPAGELGSPEGPCIKQQLPGDALFDGLLDDASDDEDLRADLERERQVQARLEAAAAARSPPGAAAGRAGLDRQACVNGGHPLAGGGGGSGSGSEDGGSGGEGGSDGEAAGARAPRPRPPPPVRASRKGVAATLALLQCCVGEPPERWESEDAEAAAPGSGRGRGGSPPASPSARRLLQGGAAARGPPPRVRWYDARARVAVKAVAAWLQVASAQLATLEVLLTSDKAPTAKGFTPEEEDSWSRRMRYLKARGGWGGRGGAIGAAGSAREGGGSQAAAREGGRRAEREGGFTGSQTLLPGALHPLPSDCCALSPPPTAQVGAAAVGGGALFAVTGGLAAPAIVAGLMSILPVIGAPAVMASSVAGLGTASGVALTTGAQRVGRVSRRGADAGARAWRRVGCTGTGQRLLVGAIGAAGAATTGTRMAHRVGNVAEFGFRELRAAEAAAPAPVPARDVGGSAPVGRGGGSGRLAEELLQVQQAQREQQEEHGRAEASQQQAQGKEQQEQEQMQGSAGGAQQQDRQAAKAAAAEGAEGADLGHLTGFPSASGRRRGPGGLARTPSRSTTDSASHTGSAGEPADGIAASAPPAPSAWARWFGGGGGAEAEAPLLRVPIRARPGGDTRLSVVIGVAGWVSRASDFESTWGCLGLACPDADAFACVWETRELLALNSALSGLVAQQATGQGVRLAVHSFFYAGAGLVAALSPTMILGVASGMMINNAWQARCAGRRGGARRVASDRALKAGKLLAELLEAGAHGDRPVSLIGHGMGARLIFSCLLELCRRNCRGVVENVVLLGAPVETQPARWQMARRVVAGRLVNCYSRRDWLLGVCYGGSVGWMRAAAGLVPIEGVAGVENCNLTRVVEGHFSHLDALPEVLLGLGLFSS